MFQFFEQIRDLANNVAKPEACAEWTFACGRIIAATRKVEELLKPHVAMGVLSGHGKIAAIFDRVHVDDGSELLTHPTAPSAPQPAFSASITTDTRAHLEEETCKLPESAADEEDLKELQELEEELLVLRAKHPQKNHPNVENLLRRLGELSMRAGDLQKARQHLAKSLRKLGELSMLAGDLQEATQHLEESLRIYRTLHGDRDHPEVVATLRVLSQLSQKTGELEKTKRYLEEALRIVRALYGDRGHLHVGAMLLALGRLSKKTGDLEKAKQYLE